MNALFFHLGALCLGTNCKLSIIEYRQNNTQFILSNHCHHFFNLDFLFHNVVLDCTSKIQNYFPQKGKKTYNVKMVF